MAASSWHLHKYDSQSPLSLQRETLHVDKHHYLQPYLLYATSCLCVSVNESKAVQQQAPDSGGIAAVVALRCAGAAALQRSGSAALWKSGASKPRTWQTLITRPLAAQQPAGLSTTL
jgi:hypothetical protein